MSTVVKCQQRKPWKCCGFINVWQISFCIFFVKKFSNYFESDKWYAVKIIIANLK